MRQRFTYLHEPQDAIDPAKLQTTKDSISSTTLLKAAREERTTFGFDELPRELYKVLKASHELHIRWVSEKIYESTLPLASRLSPGLHVFYTPQKGRNSSSQLCPTLKKLFGDIDCISPEKSFTTLPTERFSHSAATQYYAPLPSLYHLSAYVSHKNCPTINTCYGHLPSRPEAATLDLFSTVLSQSLSQATTLDISFDTISHALTITTFYPSTTQPLSLREPSSSRLEVGILSHEAAIEPEELSLAGFLIVIGEDSHPSPTLFSFPSRHHRSSQSFTSSFIPPTGLHPVLELEISDAQPPLEERSCALHAHLTLPRGIFVDRYQFTDSLFLTSKNLTALRYLTPSVDLEAPAYKLTTWGSSALFELMPPLPSLSTSPPTTAWTAQTPLHLRYLPPSHGTGGNAELRVPAPALFWACTADEGSKFPVNPFDRVNLGYDGLFGPRTLFYHLEPRPSGEGGRLVSNIDVPVLDLDGSRWIEAGTSAVVCLGFAWVAWCLLRVWNRVGYGLDKPQSKVRKGKKTD